MKLQTIRVTNFRSVEDSGVVDIDQVTCLVGKNEAGKTAILTALAGFNPHPSSPISYVIERDYPRRHLNDYEVRHTERNAEVIRTTWTLDDDEIAEVEALLCPGALRSPIVTGTRRYKADDIEWNAEVDYPKVIEAFLSELRLSAPERSQLGNPANTQELRAAIANLESPSEKQRALLYQA
jgi:energy-coupling factor transporter ATP-binding protein EcfA2